MDEVEDVEYVVLRCGVCAYGGGGEEEAVEGVVGGLCEVGGGEERGGEMVEGEKLVVLNLLGGG